MCVFVSGTHNFVCDCSEESKKGKERAEGGSDGKQLGGRGGESRDSEKSISAEYLIKFKPSDLSLLPGSKASRDAGERGGSCRKRG